MLPTYITQRLDRRFTATEGATQPVTVAEARTALDMVTADTATITDATLGQYIKYARRQVEQWTGYNLCTKTIVMIQTGFAGLPFIELPGVPLASVTSVITIDDDNDENTFANTNYYVHTAGDQHGQVVLNDTAVWPYDLRDQHNVKVTYVSGYTNADSDNLPPQDFQEWIKQLIKLYWVSGGVGIISNEGQSEYTSIMNQALAVQRPY